MSDFASLSLSKTGRHSFWERSYRQSFLLLWKPAPEKKEKKIMTASSSLLQSERWPPPCRPKGTCPRVLSHRRWPGVQHHLLVWSGIWESLLNFRPQCPSVSVSLSSYHCCLFLSSFILPTTYIVAYSLKSFRKSLVRLERLVCVQRPSFLWADDFSLAALGEVCWAQSICTSTQPANSFPMLSQFSAPYRQILQWFFF